jgi:hypothetical protein
VTSLTNKWFIESGEKLSTISGGLSSRINAVTGLNGATASTNFFLATSGNTLWSWYSISASKLSESGNKYSDVYSWYNESAQKLSDISGNLRANFMFSSIALSIFAHSTNINERFVGSSSALGKYMQSSSALSVFANSTNINSRFVASGVILYNISTQSMSGGTFIGVLQNPTMNFNIANVKLLSGQNINLTRFKCPTGKKVYVWQAAACNSGGASVSGLSIEVLSGNTQLGTWASIYKTSSAILQQGYPLATSDIDSNIEIRFMYSGLHEYGTQVTQVEYGTGFMNVSVY